MSASPVTMSREETTLVRQAILPVFLSGTDGSVEGIGTCWIVSTCGRDAIAFSAAHIFDYVVRREERHERSVPSTPPDFLSRTSSSIDLQLTRLKAIYQQSDYKTAPVDILRVFKSESHDLAICHLRLQSDVAPDVMFRKKIDIHSAPVAINEEIQIAGYSKLRETEPIVDISKNASQFVVVPEVKFLTAKITNRYLHSRPGGPDGPCYEVDCESIHGMSGGPVFLSTPGKKAVACGVISRGNSFVGDVTACAELWPAFALKLEHIMLAGSGPLSSLVDLVEKGLVVDDANGPEHFRSFVDKQGNGIIGWE